jgi:hypothetical protein
MPFAGFTAVTTHVAAPVTLSTLPVTAQPVPVTLKVTARFPEPPVVVKVSGVPVEPVRVVFEMLSGVWGAKAKVNVTAVALTVS